MQPAPRPLDICVIGAGIVGCATAQTLAESGHRVTLLDASDVPGSGASGLPIAQFSPFDVEPLATPVLLRRLGHELRHHEAPIGLTLKPSWRQWWWCVQFARACRSTVSQRGTRALLALALLSRDELDARIARSAVEVPLKRRGKLTVYTDADSLDAAAYRVALHQELGCDQSLLKPAEAMTLEPTLGSMKERLLGATWTPDETALDPRDLAQQLLRQMLVLGGQWRSQSRVLGFSRDGARVTAVRTERGDVLCDAVVLANGAEAPLLARRLGLHLPIAPIKGHGIALPIRHPELAPAITVTDWAQRMTFVSTGSQLHVSGLIDLAGHDLRRDPHRVRTLLNATKALFPDSCEFTADPGAWTGLRAETPGGLPLIGPTRLSNVWLNVGHGAYGVTLAMGSARLLERWIAGQVDANLAAPFLLSR